MKKYTDVDIVAELQKLVDSHVDSYKEDFDIDKRIIRRAAKSQNPEDRTLMWFCRPHGTHCLNENQVFIQGTRDHNTFRFYAEQTYDECVARVIVPKAVKRGKVFGDVFEINYREQAANVAQNSVAPDHDRLTFADGFVLEAPCRSSFDEAMALVSEHGGVQAHRTLPKDAEALAEVLTKQKSHRDRLPEAERTEALANTKTGEIRDGFRVQYKFGYDFYGKIKYIADSENIIIEDTVFDEMVTISLIFEKETCERLQKKLVEETNANIEQLLIEKIKYITVDDKWYKEYK